MPHSKLDPIAIVGGGPCGLTFARLLETAGIDYVVFEREVSSEPTPRFQGGTLDLHFGTGQEALRRAGLSAEFEKVARRDAMTMTVQDFQGNHRTTFGETRDAPEIDRLQLRQMLLDSIPEHRIRWGKILCSVENSGKKSGAPSWVLRFSDGTTESGFGLIVGADGAWSQLRQIITSAKPQYSGMIFIEGHLSHDNPKYKAALDMVGAGNSMATGAKTNLVVQQMGDRSYRVYMGLVAPETVTRPGGEADVTDMTKARAAMLGPGGYFADWAPDLRAFIEYAEGPWRAWPLYHMDSDVFLPVTGEGDQASSRWVSAQGATLLGDAAHISIPNGEGVNQAMYDALVLFDSVVRELGGDKAELESSEAQEAALARAVVAYEAEMLPRARVCILRCLEDIEMFWGEDAASRMIQMFNGIDQQGSQEGISKVD
ncbi:hypothetical protein MYU51_004723 [Penicillium brevicompactum]|uniref:uncharacterized protein n=1 Tax=Penicillium brevicompactum TaxID=5074 RepID=UPI002540CFD1|nr:uncharacterized protein N7506_007988 [Penicillium brevicompactum]KAJ5334205.1 hypothetical protein N7506_007988 [Penicillium brevicompactum]